MKFSTVTALSLATVAYGQSLADLPTCALQCFIGPVQSDGCPLTDYKCHCQQSDLIPKVQPCVQSKCSPSDQETVFKGVTALCAQYGISISISAPSTPSTTEESSVYSTSTPYTTSASGSYPPVYSSTPVYTHPYTTSSYSYPTSNGTATISSPIITPTAGAAKFAAGGAAALFAGVAAVAGL